MKSVVAFVLAAAAVFAAPLELGHDFTAAKLAVFHHVAVHEGHGAAAPKLRFVHLVPKVAHLGEFADGLGCAATGHALKVHKFLAVADGEKLVELLGLSDCKHWHVALLGVWSVHAGHVVHKAYVDGHPASGLDALVDHVHTKLLGLVGGAALFAKLLREGLVAHVFTHKLHAAMLPHLTHL